MKRLALVALMLLSACEKTPSKLEGTASGGAGGGGDEDTAELMTALRGIEDRLKSLETAHGSGAHNAGGQGDQAITERIKRMEANLTRREEALGFLEMAYAQQKRQQEAQEAQEPDPNAVFAVDVSKAVAAGQVEGPSSAMVTVVEAWDFA
ncbi:MAG: hypothetical protein H0V17_02415 [Deltaproteobacteria bacterium]|nr:hypothetical protein [Deltaproteobacteria bacterium]